MNDRHRLSMNLLKVYDLLSVMLAFGLSTALVVKEDHKLSLAQFLALRTRVSDFAIFALGVVVCHVALSMCGLYRSMRLSSWRTEVSDLVRATALGVTGFAVLGLLFSVEMMTLRFLAIFWAFTVAILGLSRQAVRLGLRYLRVHGRNLRYMLIVGTNPPAVEFAQRILANRDRGIRLLGFIDDAWPGIEEFKRTGFQLLTDFAGLPGYLRENIVDEVAIYLPLNSFFEHYAEVADLCETHGIVLRFNADIFPLKTTRWRTEVFDGDHHIATYAGPGEAWAQIVKRLLDISVSGILLILFFPILVSVVVAIKLSTSGPAFFRQERIGLNKRRFKIFKFRTMVVNAEQLIAGLEKDNEAGGPAFKLRNDPRITPIGKFLRRSSIDELPQLFNVFRGDMSLVGPRPLPVRDYKGFSEDWQRRRFSVKPGITCLWQVNGRSSITFEQWMMLDLQYMDEWSLWLDFKILAKTVPAVLKGAGAV